MASTSSSALLATARPGNRHWKMVGYVHVRLFVPTTCADILVLFSLCCSFDMAAFAKKGSALVKEKREQAERPCAKAAAKLAVSGGTALGNIWGQG
jgi:hypothetical protein